MFVVIRGARELSIKSKFIVKLFGLTPDNRFLYVFLGNRRFEEKWSSEKIELATSISSIFVHYLLTLLKSPKSLHDGAVKRLSSECEVDALVNGGFLSALLLAFYVYFVKSAQELELAKFFKKMSSPKIFLLDEFVSLRVLNLRMLKTLGPIIYVSQDFAYNRFDFEDSFAAKILMCKLERDAISQVDLVIACSERDRLKYVEMGAKKAVFYPNIYPVEAFESSKKDQEPSISIVLQSHWGSRGEKYLEEIFKALSFIDEKIRVYMIGLKPRQVPKNIELQYCKCIPNKLNYIRTLNRSWIGINIGIHMGGANERKYDYALAELVVFSDTLGARGDLLPYEYTYVDSHDLAAKLEQLLNFGKQRIEEMGIENRKSALATAGKQEEIVKSTINEILAQNIESKDPDFP